MQKLLKRPLIILLSIGLLIGAYKLWTFTNAVPEVGVIRVVAGPAQQLLAVVGRVRAKDVVDVRSENPGAIIEMLHDEGDQVLRGTLLARIKSNQQQAVVEVNQAQIEALDAQFELAQIQYRRAATLARLGWITKSALDQARASLKAAQANRRAAQASANQARARVNEFDVRSPMVGTILARPLDLGQVVGLTDVIFQMGSAGPIEIEAEVDEFYADDLQVGMTTLMAPSGSEAKTAGRITEISPRVDPRTGGRLVRFMLDGANGEFRPGRSVDININVNRFDRAISVPRSALKKEGAVWQAYAIVDGKIAARTVTFIDWPGKSVIIRSGVKAGDSLVLDAIVAVAGSRAKAKP